MPTKEEFELAQKELISFLSLFSGMMVGHLNQIRDVMAETTDSVMQGVGNISDARDNKKKMAETILVKKGSGNKGADVQGGDDTFEAVVSADDSNSEEVAASLQLKQHMQSFSHLDDRIEEILFTMIGSMSADDVVGQRMEHINKALSHLSAELSKIIGTKAATNFKNQDINVLKDNIIELMKKSYTMEEEHEVMERVFNKEASDKKAS